MAGPGPRILFAVHATSARRDKKLSDAAFRTLCALAEYVNYTGGAAFPSIKTLAQQRGTSERSIQRHLRELERRNHLQTVQGRQHSTNNYFLLFNGRRRAVSPREIEGAWRQLSLFEPGVTPSVAPEPARGDTQCHRGGDTQCHPNKTIEHSRHARPRAREENGHGAGNGHHAGAPISEVLAAMNGSPLGRRLASLGRAIEHRCNGNGQAKEGL